tara:strand:- start:1209 stop:2957 length:1749 start_codon:yes stop_codon:yes gene_type:complete
MIDFENRYEYQLNGQNIDVRGNQILITYPTSLSTQSIFYSSDNGQTFNNINLPNSRITIPRITSDGSIIYVYSTISNIFYKVMTDDESSTHVFTRPHGKAFQISNNGQYFIWCGPETFISDNFGDTYDVLYESYHDVDMSDSGEYVTLISKIDGNLNIKVSNIYGKVWTDIVKNIGGETTLDNMVKVSNSGQYILIMVKGYNLFLSNNYGYSFNEVSNTTQNWSNIEISSDPQYMYAQINAPNTIWESTDYGETWNMIYSTEDNVNYKNLFFGNDYMITFDDINNLFLRYSMIQDTNQDIDTNIDTNIIERSQITATSKMFFKLGGTRNYILLLSEFISMFKITLISVKIDMETLFTYTQIQTYAQQIEIIQNSLQIIQDASIDYLQNSYLYRDERYYRAIVKDRYKTFNKILKAIILLITNCFPNKFFYEFESNGNSRRSAFFGTDISRDQYLIQMFDDKKLFAFLNLIREIENVFKMFLINLNSFQLASIQGTSLIKNLLEIIRIEIFNVLIGIQSTLDKIGNEFEFIINKNVDFITSEDLTNLATYDENGYLISGKFYDLDSLFNVLYSNLSNVFIKLE